MKTVKTTLLLLAAVMLIGCQPVATGSPTATTSVTNHIGNQVYDIAPDLELQDLKGNTVFLYSFRGSPVVLNFWKID